MYSAYEGNAAQPGENESEPSDRTKVVILGGGPNRIGQGIEFDYCCVMPPSPCGRRLRIHHGELQPGDRIDRLRHLGPAVFRAADRRGRDRTDPGRAGARRREGRDRSVRRPTPLKLAQALEDAGIPILGTSPDAIDSPRTGSGSRNCSPSWTSSSRPTAPRPRWNRRKRRPGEEDRLSRGHPALLRPGRAGPWRSSTTRNSSTGTWIRRCRSPARRPC